MSEEEIEKIKQSLEAIEEKLTKVLTAELYEEVKNLDDKLKYTIIGLNKELNRMKENKQYWSDKYYDNEGKVSEARRSEEKWKNYYHEVVKKQAETEIELDVANIKIKELYSQLPQEGAKTLIDDTNLEKYIDENTCLQCGKGKPRYCEDCMQKIISENARLQKNEI